MLHPELARFQHRLESTGTVVAAHADHLCVRLPLLISLRVRYDGERIAFDPRFGAVSRATATMATFGVVNAAVVGAAVAGLAVPALVTIGTAGVLAAAYEALRYIVVESAITRVAMLWGTRRDTAMPPALGVGPAEPVRAGGVGDPDRVRMRDE